MFSLNLDVLTKIGYSFTFSSLIIMLPLSGLIRPVIRLNIVDLPTPLGPKHS